MRKALFVFAGLISLSLGIIGIFVPGLPTTPFLLLTAFLFMQSSPKLHKMLINNKFLGKYINNYSRRKGMTKKQKMYSLALMWSMISLSVIVFVDSVIIDFIIIALGVTGTFVMGFVVPLGNDEKDKN
jgi:uncharacterized protein